MGNIMRKSKKLMRFQKSLRLLVLLVSAATLFYLIFTNFNTIKYALRPIWDTPPKAFHYIPHYYSASLSMEELCSLHGWRLRKSPRRVFDAVIFNNELDLLEIRWQELHPHVTKFLLLESNGTFTGISKSLVFEANRERFAFLTHQELGYAVFPAPRLSPGRIPKRNEHDQRVAMDSLIQSSGIQPGDLLIMSDVDEIPSRHTIDLLRNCDGYPPIMHLQLKNYLYSFEFQINTDRSDSGSWRSSVHIYDPGATTYDHVRVSDHLLADAGWHCSFCFRRIKDIVFKIQAYSHADRVTNPKFLDEGRIQEVICSGRDLFDMLPEEYSFKNLIGKMGSVPSSYSAVNLPSHLLRNSKRFKYLLPGNCRR